ncbi:unnamed protein product [Trichogramma brassicae]|uniref:Reverse transcriptase domain-containing protein n=1 Tax=Trichogramma brassicae TaxID=86971 RepID=A0A6H5HYD9_9HYME|nr:unnamed protein product [Trichogramma brassicae]
MKSFEVLIKSIQRNFIAHLMKFNDFSGIFEKIPVGDVLTFHGSSAVDFHHLYRKIPFSRISAEVAEANGKSASLQQARTDDGPNIPSGSTRPVVSEAIQVEFIRVNNKVRAALFQGTSQLKGNRESSLCDWTRQLQPMGSDDIELNEKQNYKNDALSESSSPKGPTIHEKLPVSRSSAYALQSHQAAPGHRSSTAYCVIVTLDGRNAFNLAHWNHIPRILKKIGALAYFHRVIGSYFNDRVLHFSTDDVAEVYNVTDDVSQGSVLGLIFWNAMYNKLLSLNLLKTMLVVDFVGDIAQDWWCCRGSGCAATGRWSRLVFGPRRFSRDFSRETCNLGLGAFTRCRESVTSGSGGGRQRFLSLRMFEKLSFDNTNNNKGSRNKYFLKNFQMSCTSSLNEQRKIFSQVSKMGVRVLEKARLDRVELFFRVLGSNSIFRVLEFFSSTRVFSSTRIFSSFGLLNYAVTIVIYFCAYICQEEVGAGGKKTVNAAAHYLIFGQKKKSTTMGSIEEEERQKEEKKRNEQKEREEEEKREKEKRKKTSEKIIKDDIAPNRDLHPDQEDVDLDPDLEVSIVMDAIQLVMVVRLESKNDSARTT